MATDRVAKTSSTLSETRTSGDCSAHRQAVLRAIEEALTKARIDAEAIEQPVLAYFLDMAIAELESGGRSDQNGSRERQQNKAANVIQVVS